MLKKLCIGVIALSALNCQASVIKSIEDGNRASCAAIASSLCASSNKCKSHDYTYHVEGSLLKRGITNDKWVMYSNYGLFDVYLNSNKLEPEFLESGRDYLDRLLKYTYSEKGCQAYYPFKAEDF